MVFGVMVSFCQKTSNEEQIKTNCNQFQQMLAFFMLPCTSLNPNCITLSYQLTAKDCKVKLNKNLYFSKERPGRVERPHICPQAKHNITLIRRQKLLAHALYIWVASYTGFYWVIFRVRGPDSQNQIQAEMGRLVRLLKLVALFKLTGKS